MRPAGIEYFKNGERRELEDLLATEATIHLELNSHPLASLRCTPQYVRELARGFLIGEGWVDHPAQILAIEYDEDKSLVSAKIDVPEDQIEYIRGKLSISSGCGGGLSRNDLELDLDCDHKYDTSVTLDFPTLKALLDQFNQNSEMYRQTHCVHLAMIFDGAKVLACADDIGRHNAVDKVVGLVSQMDIPFSRLGLFTSGRVTLDIAAKMSRLRAAFIVSTSAASFDAIELAKQFHIGVVGRLRPSSFKIYCTPWRIKS
jgi:FdhD protein